MLLPLEQNQLAVACLQPSGEDHVLTPYGAFPSIMIATWLHTEILRFSIEYESGG